MIAARNLYAGKKNFILFMDHNYKTPNECGSGYYNLSVVKDAVPFFDFIIFFEDLRQPLYLSRTTQRW